MITTTLRELLSGDYVEPDGATVYVIRDGDVIFYVGRTTDAIGTRLWRHLVVPIAKRAASWVNSQLGRLVHANAPESGDWQVDLMSRRDCWPYVKALYPGFPDDSWGRDLGAHCSEVAMIRALKPCLNVACNDNRRKPPDRYCSGEVERDSDPAEGYVDYGEV